mgnify:CR=1 FL=1
MNPNLIVMKRWKIPFLSTRKTVRENFKLNFTQAYILTLIMIGILGVYYVWTLNANATRWYTMRNLEMTKRTLLFEDNLLDVKIAEVESLNNVTSNPVVQKMDKIDKPQYLILKDSNLVFSNNWQKKEPVKN